MGWTWVDEPTGRGLGSVGELENPNPRSMKDSTTRIISTICRTEEVEPGRFIRKCENKEYIFSALAGRPAKLVQSITEHTEDDITDAIKSGVIPFRSSGPEPFNVPDLESEIMAIDKRLLDGFSHFLHAAEKMATGLINSLKIPSFSNRESPSFDRAERQPEQHVPKKHDSRSSGPEPFNLPDLESEIMAIDQRLLDGFSHFLDAAEKMATGLFNSLKIPSLSNRESPSFDRAERQPEQHVPKKHDSPSSEISEEIKEV